MVYYYVWSSVILNSTLGIQKSLWNARNNRMQKNQLPLLSLHCFFKRVSESTAQLHEKSFKIVKDTVVGEI